MSYQKEAISVLVVDDHPLVRDGLKSNLDKIETILTVYESCNARDAVYKCTKHSPDIVLMDINLPDLNGIEATRLIMENNPQTRVIGLSVHIEKEYVMGMMKAGAKGFLTKTCSSGDLVDAIGKISSNQAYICNEVLDLVVKAAVNHQEESFDDTQLTHREAQILRLIANGKTNQEVGDILIISTRTVEKHRKNLMDKLDIRTVAQLTKYAIRHGLVSLD